MNNFRFFFRIIPYIMLYYWKYWNRLKFSILGVKYGVNMCVTNKLYIKGKGKLKIGRDFAFSSGACHNPISRNIYGSIYIGNPQSQIIIGDRVGISSACLWAEEEIIIGNDVNIGSDCLIMDNDAHPLDYIKRRASYKTAVGERDYLNSIATLPVLIEDDVWIGARCQILKGVHIGARSIIAAGSIVTKDIPHDVLAGGNPCKVIRSLSEPVMCEK